TSWRKASTSPTTRSLAGLGAVGVVMGCLLSGDWTGTHRSRYHIAEPPPPPTAPPSPSIRSPSQPYLLDSMVWRPAPLMPVVPSHTRPQPSYPAIRPQPEALTGAESRIPSHPPSLLIIAGK